MNLEERKSSLKIKFLGGIFLKHQGPRRRDIPDKHFLQVAFFCGFRQGVARMSRDLGRDVPDLEKLYAKKLWIDFFGDSQKGSPERCHFGLFFSFPFFFRFLPFSSVLTNGVF